MPGGPQGLDRYAYVNNSPVRYTDPTGHRCADGDEDLWGYCDYTPRPSSMLIPRAIDNFFDIKDDPVELITRAILGEQAEKLFTSKEDDAVGVAWAIRNRYESGVSVVHEKA